jgi:hypothetical protein
MRTKRPIGTLAQCAGLTLNRCALTYEAGSATKLKLSDKGTDGFEEMQEELNDGKVQFIYIRFDVGGLKKFCYIGFCGAAVSGMQRGNFNNHYNDFSHYLKVIQDYSSDGFR